ncbi:bifunctional UDP-N-acetylglucosamine diphosphorylase/glucosamine-1-phosphate N-acetyltransferase GlmU [Sphingomonas parva]|uniref:Bifunctional protein GlmU n=1 Tax=Sphingomonas parva TaxID=2555898 RepID=A0A4Y8ZTF0_9SPHN|nr:bifunctional UDP-N-acetylglucosamine diphosphorylase/glucosamine-1-phosphate N-acetyltransferase GlmU [Sphingomonas parva]TFI59194.1 bifunctional UDP-N-acetylglucosamine diphosphorylase/glucosamine-1-phosphate N-acetyltransferase GlmU [Sphingomonas parva]
MNPSRPFAAIILAAGKGTRMKSDLHKVLHPIAGRPMLEHLLASIDQLGAARTVVVVGNQREQLEAALAGRGIEFAVQEPQLGTAHAVLQAREALAGFDGDVLLLSGDVPFVRPETMRQMLDALNAPSAPASVVLGFRPDDSAAYGRIVAAADGRIEKMVEHKDASEEERQVGLCNSNLFAVRAGDLWPLLERVGNDNAQREYYLPDIVMVAASDGRPSVVIEGEAAETIGPNSRAEFAAAELLWQSRRRRQAMADGASLVAPETVWFAFDTKVGRDVVIEPNVVFGPGVTVADGVTIRAFSHIEGASIAAGAEIGPYARLRPGAEIGEKAKVGNFVEVKKARLGRGAKANHLSYIGDAEVGARANIGAGTITCNYDGFFKYRTVIGEEAFIGSNSALVAPVAIGAGAIVGAGSVVTGDVEAGALALARGTQQVKPGWAARFRAAMSSKKKAS